MRDLQRYANECINDLKVLGINPRIDVKDFSVNTRAKSRYGQCKKVDGKFTININSDLLRDECPVLSLRETIFHELIHTLPKCWNHGEEFLKYAEIVNKEYLVNVKRCSSYKEKYGAILAEQIRKETKKRKENKTIEYKLFCEYCGKVRASGMYKRMPKWYAHNEDFHCGVCGGNLTRLDGSYILLSAKGVF